jgi:hypothetical protein
MGLSTITYSIDRLKVSTQESHLSQCLNVDKLTSEIF